MNQTIPTQDRRAHERFPLKLEGGVRLEDGREMPCEVRGASAGGLYASCREMPPLMSRVTFRFDDLGLVDAVVLRHEEDGFAVSFVGSADRMARLGKRVEWLSRMQLGGGVEMRSGARIVPDKTEVRMTMDGVVHDVRIIDLSRTGAAVSSSLRVQVGEGVTLGMRRAKVVRNLQGGFAVEFAMSLPQAQFDHSISL